MAGGGAGMAGSGGCVCVCVAWTVRLSAPTHPFAERRIREALGKGGNFAECPDPAVGIDFFLKYLCRVPL